MSPVVLQGTVLHWVYSMTQSLIPRLAWDLDRPMETQFQNPPKSKSLGWCNQCTAQSLGERDSRKKSLVYKFICYFLNSKPLMLPQALMNYPLSPSAVAFGWLDPAGGQF